MFSDPDYDNFETYLCLMIVSNVLAFSLGAFPFVLLCLTVTEIS
tara:strand:- start:29 stop:160 length:132 start_codon:yes stop_codon:yes gene_type:complete